MYSWIERFQSIPSPTHSYVWHDSSIRLTWRMHICDMMWPTQETQAIVSHELVLDIYICTYIYKHDVTDSRDLRDCLSRDSRTCSWYIYICTYIYKHDVTDSRDSSTQEQVLKRSSLKRSFWILYTYMWHDVTFWCHLCKTCCSICLQHVICMSPACHFV